MNVFIINFKNLLKNLLFVLIMFCVVGYGKVYAASITYRLEPHQGYCDSLTINLTGAISELDAFQLSKIIESYKNINYNNKCENSGSISDITLRLNSNGGDVKEAIEMGRVIRDNGFWTVVPVNSNCLSSCVFVLIGGSLRSSVGNVGIHRPYFKDIKGNPTIKEIRQMRVKNNDYIKEFLEEMGVSVTLLDVMESIPPDEIKILDKSELEKYRIIGEDANMEEQKISQRAKSYGLTMSEYRRRDALSNSTCGTYKNTNFQICFLATILNISESEAQQRLNLGRTRCSTLSSTEEKERCLSGVFRTGR